MRKHVKALRGVAFMYGERIDKLTKALNVVLAVVEDCRDSIGEVQLTRLAEEAEWQSKELAFEDEEVWFEVAFVAVDCGLIE